MRKKGFVSKGNKIAVIGVSSDPNKWGRKVFEELKAAGFSAFAVNPKYKRIGENECFPELKDLPVKPDLVITVVPPKITISVVKQCKALGIKKVWMQPGSESPDAIEYCKKQGIAAIYNACFLVSNLKGVE